MNTNTKVVYNKVEKPKEKFAFYIDYEHHTHWDIETSEYPCEVNDEKTMIEFANLLDTIIDCSADIQFDWWTYLYDYIRDEESFKKLDLDIYTKYFWFPEFPDKKSMFWTTEDDKTESWSAKMVDYKIKYFDSNSVEYDVELKKG